MLIFNLAGEEGEGLKEPVKLSLEAAIKEMEKENQKIADRYYGDNIIPKSKRLAYLDFLTRNLESGEFVAYKEKADEDNTYLYIKNIE